MKTFGKLPSSPDIRDMNDAQWLYCYSNIIEDEKQEEELQKARIKYQALFFNPEGVKQMEKLEEAQKNGERVKSNTNTSIGTPRNDDVYVNDSFEEEMKRAIASSEIFEFPDENTVRGNPDMSSDDFINQCVNDFSHILDEEDLDIIEIE